ncbi:MAG: hypothetical protein H6635_09955 [Anaerolineales bacterium]|nr:hypothetical protein [Anaerolineales bacterium]MCB9145683.1 hypothetical protein [Anaerolineales bacterium]
MNIKRSPIPFLIAMFTTISLACAGLSPAPTAAPELIYTATNIPNPLPTATATTKPTNTPRPTRTPIPATATAIPMDLPAINAQYEVKVLYAAYFSKVFSGGFEYTPLYGGKFLDIGVQIKNLQPGSPLTIPWENIYIITPDNKAWYPNFGGSYSPQNKEEKFDPATLFIYPEDVMEDINFSEVVYIRGIWATDGAKPATYLFGFDTAPLIEVIID